MTRPAGWYPDPEGSGGQRYWTGESWSIHKAPESEVPAAPRAPSKSGIAAAVLISLVVGVVLLLIAGVATAFLTLRIDNEDDEIYLDNTLADLNPGDSVETAVVFDVPVGTDPESIELHDGPFSDGVTVGL